MGQEPLIEPEARVLDPVERLAEVLFGLIMVLSFTGSLSAASAERGEVRTVLLAAIGCNLAWGIVDGVMYLLTILIQRGRTLALAHAVRAARSEAEAHALLGGALPDALAPLLGPGDLEGLRRKIVALPELPARPRLRRQEWLAALGVCLLVFCSTFPVVLPFVFFSPLSLAMRVSNGVAIALLYAAGHLLGRHAGFSGVKMGLAMVAIGVALVGLTIALGG
ncbi:MAG: VIT family protein [Planctomycetes bacterium]|nr:VIT family protein [Planctomycetota bacterium]